MKKPTTPIEWGNIEIATPNSVLDPKDVSATPSPDGSALSILFTGLKAELLEGGAETSAIRVAAFSVPLKVPAVHKLAGFRVGLRGFITKGINSRASLIMDIGGATRILAFPYGDEKSENFTFAMRSQGQHPQNSLYVSLVLILQRTDTDQAKLVIDSIDSLNITPILKVKE